MNVDQFTNILMVVLIVLQVLSVAILVKSKEKIKGSIFVIVMNMVVLLGIMKIPIEDKDGKPIEHLGDLTGNFLAISMITFSVSVLSLIGGFMASPSKLGFGKRVILPVIGIVLFYGSIEMSVKLD